MRSTKVHCEFCGRFIDENWLATNNYFTAESATYCRTCARDMPANHEERQQWIVRQLP